MDCLEENGSSNENIESTTRRLYQRAENLIKDTLEIEGALVLDISNPDIDANIRDISPSDEVSTSTSAYYLTRSHDDEMETSSEEMCQSTVSESGLSSHFIQNQANYWALKIRGASVDDRSALQPPSGSFSKWCPSSFTEVKPSSSMGVKPDGEIYDESQIPVYLRRLMPANSRYAMGEFLIEASYPY